MEQLPPTNLFNNITDEQTIFDQDIINDNSPDTDIFLEQDEDDDNLDTSPGITKAIKKFQSNKKRYDNITNDMRLKLIDAVENRGQKIKHAAKKLNINYSSAKSICQVFKREGRSNKKTFKRREVKIDNSAHISNELPQSTQPVTTEPAKPSNEPLKLPDQEQPEQQDSLMKLRDRLLGSRAESHMKQTYQEIPLKIDSSSANSNESGYSQIQSTKPGSPSELKSFQQYSGGIQNVQNVQNPYYDAQQVQQVLMMNQQQQQQQQQQQAAIQQKPNMLMNGMQGQMVYMVPMVLPSQQTMIPNGFGSMISQSITPSGPTQTININQPYAKNMNIQTISIDSNSLNKASPIGMNGMNGMNFNSIFSQKPMTMQAAAQPQQLYSAAAGYPNFAAVNQMNGGAQGVMQSPMYMMHQGNLIQVNAYPQVIQAGSGVNVAYNSSYGLNYMPVQANGVYPWGNSVGYAGLDAKQKINGISGMNGGVPQQQMQQMQQMFTFPGLPQGAGKMEK